MEYLDGLPEQFSPRLVPTDQSVSPTHADSPGRLAADDTAPPTMMSEADLFDLYDAISDVSNPGATAARRSQVAGVPTPVRESVRPRVAVGVIVTGTEPATPAEAPRENKTKTRDPPANTPEPADEPVRSGSAEKTPIVKRKPVTAPAVATNAAAPKPQSQPAPAPAPAVVAPPMEQPLEAPVVSAEPLPPPPPPPAAIAAETVNEPKAHSVSPEPRDPRRTRLHVDPVSPEPTVKPPKETPITTPTTPPPPIHAPVVPPAATRTEQAERSLLQKTNAEAPTVPTPVAAPSAPTTTTTAPTTASERPTKKPDVLAETTPAPEPEPAPAPLQPTAVAPLEKPKDSATDATAQPETSEAAPKTPASRPISVNKITAQPDPAAATAPIAITTATTTTQAAEVAVMPEANEEVTAPQTEMETTPRSEPDAVPPHHDDAQKTPPRRTSAVTTPKRKSSATVTAAATTTSIVTRTPVKGEPPTSSSQKPQPRQEPPQPQTQPAPRQSRGFVRVSASSSHEEAPAVLKVGSHAGSRRASGTPKETAPTTAKNNSKPASPSATATSSNGTSGHNRVAAKPKAGKKRKSLTAGTDETVPSAEATSSAPPRSSLNRKPLRKPQGTLDDAAAQAMLDDLLQETAAAVGASPGVGSRGKSPALTAPSSGSATVRTPAEAEKRRQQRQKVLEMYDRNGHRLHAKEEGPHRSEVHARTTPKTKTPANK